MLLDPDQGASILIWGGNVTISIQRDNLIVDINLFVGLNLMSSEGNHTMEVFVVSASRVVIDDHTTNTNFTIDDLMIKCRATSSDTIAPVSTLGLRLRRQGIKSNTKSHTSKKRPKPSAEEACGSDRSESKACETTSSHSGRQDRPRDRISFRRSGEDNETGRSKQNSFEQVFHSIQYLSVSGSNGRETYPSCPTKMPLYPSTIPSATPEREFVLLATILPLGGTLLLAV